MDLKVFILISSLLVISINATEIIGNYTEDYYFNCTECKCVNVTGKHSFLRGDDFALCVHFIATTPANETHDRLYYQTRAAYPIKVDEYTVVKLNNAQGPLAQSAYDQVKIVVQAHGDTKSFPIAFFNLSSKGNFYAKNYSLVIQTNNGIVQNATWDNKCSTCDFDQCYKTWYNGSVFDGLCLEKDCLTTTSLDCDPQIYISWIGSDKDGEKMTSSSLRVSRFNQYSLTEVYSKAQTYLNSEIKTETTVEESQDFLLESN